MCLPDSLQVPNIPIEASLVEHVDRYYTTLKPVQSYYGALRRWKIVMECHLENPQVRVKKLMSESRGLQKLRNNGSSGRERTL